VSQPRSDETVLTPPRQHTALMAGWKFGPFLPTHGESGQAAQQPPIRVLMSTQHMSPEQLRELLAGHPHDAVRWITTAARAGFTAAQVVLGQLLLDGRGMARDAAQAFVWFEKAATAGDIEAGNMLGRCYEQGWGVAANPALATQCFANAAQRGHVWGRVNLAQMLMRAGDPADRPRCFELFRVAAEGGTSKPHLKAMNSLARFLEEGWAGSPDLTGAAFWYFKAAQLGDHWAQYNLATILYRHGDEASAAHWLQSAVTISDNGFRRRIAPLLLACPAPALRRYGLDALQRCAQSNAAEDLYAYGLALHEAVAGAGDPVEAQLLFRAAAAQGHMQAARLIHPTPPIALIRRAAARVLDLTRHCSEFIRGSKAAQGTNQ